MRHLAVATVITLALFLGTSVTAADKVSSQGVDIPVEIEVDGDRLVLFGHGVARYARIFRVYVAALYGPEDLDPESFLASDAPRRLEITYLRDVGADDIREATRVVIDRQYSESQRDELLERFDRFNRLYEDVGAGDQYAYEYRPQDEESRLYLNGELQGTETGSDLARAYLGIWLAEEGALSDSLREDLLFGRR